MSTRHGSATVVLPSDTTILITRSFDAPAALIFRALTEPELVTRWWGFEDAQWEVCEIDLRVGGTWRYVVRQPCESEPDRRSRFMANIASSIRRIGWSAPRCSKEFRRARLSFPPPWMKSTGSRRCVSWCNTLARNTATGTSNRAWRSACRSATTASKICFATSDDKTGLK